MQDAVIAMAVIVLALALWRLQSRPAQWGKFGSWAGTNIFGPVTLSLISGSGRVDNGSRPPAGNAGEPTPVSNAIPSIQSTEVAPVSNQPPANLPNTNELATVIPVGTFDQIDRSNSSVMEQRLNEVSAKGGDIQISLFWKNFNDLDLHCIDPAREEIFFSHKKSNSGGELDVDQNASQPFNNSPVENIYWPVGAAPPGLYRVSVVHYAKHGGMDPTAFTVRTVVNGQTNFFTSSISYTAGQAHKPVCAFQYDPADADPSRRLRFGP